MSSPRKSPLWIMIDLPYNPEDFWETTALWFVNAYAVTRYITTGSIQISRSSIKTYIEQPDATITPLLNELRTNRDEVVRHASEWGRPASDITATIEAIIDFWENLWLTLSPAHREEVAVKASALLDAYFLQRNGARSLPEN